MVRKPIFNFVDDTSTGLDKVPLNSTIVIEYPAGTPKQIVLTDKTSITDTTTIATLLGLTAQYTTLDGSDVIVDTVPTNGSSNLVDSNGVYDAVLAAQPFVHSFDYDKTTNHTVTSDAYIEVTRLTTPSRDAGTYVLDLSMIYSLNSTTTSAFFRFTVDGGSNWVEVRKEPKDNLDSIIMTYISVETHAGGVFEVIIQSRKEIIGDTLIISALDIIFERKA